MKTGRVAEFLRRHVLSPLTIVIVTAALLLGYLLWFGYQEAMQAAEVNARNLTWMIESRFGAALDRTRATLDEMAARLNAEMLRPEAVAAHQGRLNAELDLELSHFRELDAFRVFDASGDLLYTSGADKTRHTNIADRPFFGQLRDDPQAKVAYSEVITARTNDAETVIVCRALRAADGRFLGMIGAQLKLTYFQDLFESLDVGTKGVVAIRRSDNFSLVLRRPTMVSEINRSLPVDHPIRRAIAGGAGQAMLKVAAYTDGIDRVFSLHVVKDAPFYVLAGMAEDDVLAHWRARTLAVGAVGILLLGSLWLTRGTLRRREDELVEVREVAREAEDRLRLLVKVYEHIGEAILVTDAENRIVSANRAFTRLTGYALGEVEGRNPKLLSAGRTTAEEYDAMWRAISERGRWQGEIWDRRKDGSCYPKALTISTLRDGRGKVTHYIGSFTDISERKAAEQNIHHLAHHDSLTGLPNRFSLQQRLEQAIVGARRDGRQLAVMFIDLDRFKIINDTLGHPVGDGLLVEVARRLLQSVRESDIVARMGGDEFVVVITDVSEDAAEGISTVAQKILDALSLPYRIDGHRLESTTSIGVSVFPADGNNVNMLMKNADTAMYHAKALGRHNVQFFSDAAKTAAGRQTGLP
ncbi:MAG TPA: diguanylate cyclase [Rhodocyclaceae bacterium]|nr:diguanylate cyclase [Rhodocyclaceae bacterium]